MAASYGGLAAYRTVLGALPAGFPVPILLVQHRSPGADFVAPLLARETPLVVANAADGEVLRPGTVHVLPPDRQATLDQKGRLVLAAGVRCKADALLESVAFVHGPRAIAVVLTGRLADGTAGVRAIKARGGRVLVQDSGSSQAFGMPGAAIATGCVDHVLPLRTIAAALVSLVMVPGADELFRVRLSHWAASGSA